MALLAFQFIRGADADEPDSGTCLLVVAPNRGRLGSGQSSDPCFPNYSKASALEPIVEKFKVSIAFAARLGFDQICRLSWQICNQPCSRPPSFDLCLMRVTREIFRRLTLQVDGLQRDLRVPGRDLPRWRS
jgi:hypothetical protein